MILGICFVSSLSLGADFLARAPHPRTVIVAVAIVVVVRLFVKDFGVVDHPRRLGVCV